MAFSPPAPCPRLTQPGSRVQPLTKKGRFTQSPGKDTRGRPGRGPWDQPVHLHKAVREANGQERQARQRPGREHLPLCAQWWLRLPMRNLLSGSSEMPSWHVHEEGCLPGPWPTAAPCTISLFLLASTTPRWFGSPFLPTAAIPGLHPALDPAGPAPTLLPIQKEAHFSAGSGMGM